MVIKRSSTFRIQLYNVLGEKFVICNLVNSSDAYPNSGMKLLVL